MIASAQKQAFAADVPASSDEIAAIIEARPGLLRPSGRYAVAALLRNGGLYLVALASAPLLAHAGTWLPLLAMPFIGLAMYRLTIVMHDCLHATLFASPRANRLVGGVVGAASGIEFHAFSGLHWRHHLRVGESDDPQGLDYLPVASSSRAGILWHLARPLVGYNLFKLWQVYGRLGRADGCLRQSGGRRGIMLVLCVQGTAAAIASAGFTFWWLIPLPAVSAATFGLFFAQLRGFAEHVAMPGVDPRGHVRSHHGTGLDRMLLYDLNFNLHREHHLYPAVPSCRLPQLRHFVSGRDELSRSMLGTVIRRVAAAGVRVK